jgi:thiosulfate/3-mercaptopyruvate sulfurtransferase
MEKLISKAGVSNDSHVVVVAAGTNAADIGSGARVYWSLRVLGDDNVSLLDGGMSAWTSSGKNPLAKGQAPVAASHFKAHPNAHFMASADDVRMAAKSGNLIDSRPTDQFLGLTKSGVVTRFGHVPGASSLPALWLTNNNKGFFRDKAAVEKLYAYTKAPTEDGTVTYCNTGHWGALGWFVDYAIMGKKNAKMYDASMSEWSRLKDAPMESSVALK